MTVCTIQHLPKNHAAATYKSHPSVVPGNVIITAQEAITDQEVISAQEVVDAQEVISAQEVITAQKVINARQITAGDRLEVYIKTFPLCQPIRDWGTGIFGVVKFGHTVLIQFYSGLMYHATNMEQGR